MKAVRAAIEDNLPSAKTILNALNNPIYKMYLLFLAYVFELVIKVNVELQSESPKLPFLLNRITTLYKKLLRSFKKKDVLDKTRIHKVNINCPGNYVIIENLYVGAKTDAFIKLKNENIAKEELHNFRVRILDLYAEICYQIKKRFDLNDSHLKYASNFTPNIALYGSVW
ncbi:hypothetical protein NQ314_019281 [Rhamnusium bicolor]|uniref:Uncharacterized protein n=1 Tax=Rhamnusium bicolor TaxID=1586634 RepID=A0AAV8WNM7_9CUCU|nr:hypothetical protein NQ314_019281 [Rhamnusium bicolor]